MDRTNYVKIFLNQSILVFPAIAIGAGSGHGKWWQYSGKSVGQLLAGKLSIYLLTLGSLYNQHQMTRKLDFSFLHPALAHYHSLVFPPILCLNVNDCFKLLVNVFVETKICYLTFSAKKREQIFPTKYLTNGYTK